MPDTFSFKESIELLETNPKTFKEWLHKAGIDPTQQIDLGDPRKKYLTKAQLHLLAEQHGRSLPARVDQEERQSPVVTLETLAEQLTSFRTEVMQRLAQIETRVQEIAAKPDGIATVSDSAHAIQHQLTQRFDQLHQLLHRTLLLRQERAAPEKDAFVTERQVPAKTADETGVPHKQHKEKSTAKTTTRKKGARGVRGKRLPRHLVALREFASQHGITTERASAAGKTGKIDLVRGKWLVKSRWAYEALTARGQHDFYQLFHERRGFLPCPQCPHPFHEAGSSATSG